MDHTMTIARRQFASFFNGPIAYIVCALVLLFIGFFFWTPFFLAQRASVRELFGWWNLTMILTAPALTMGLLAEEKRSGTIELLVTMPVKDSSVILGKFIGVLGLVAVMLALTLAYPLSVSTLAPDQFDWGPVLTGYLGAFLEASALCAIGLMISGWTESQIIALFGTVIVTIFFVLVGKVTQFFPSWAATALDWISFDFHFESLARGVIDTRNIMFFISLTVIALGASFVTLDSRRWK